MVKSLSGVVRSVSSLRGPAAKIFEGHIFLIAVDCRTEMGDNLHSVVRSVSCRRPPSGTTDAPGVLTILGESCPSVNVEHGTSRSKMSEA